MWFRLSGNGASNTDETNVITNNNNNNSTNNSSTEPSKFEKFRRASFRRKSNNGPTAPPRKRSKSPHVLLQKKNSTPTLDEANDETADKLCFTPKYKSEININFNDDDVGKRRDDLADSGNDTISALLLSTNEYTTKSPKAAKKLSLKAIKTEPPKRKFPKGLPTTPTTTATATAKTRRHNSNDGVALKPFRLEKIIDNEDHIKNAIKYDNIDTDDDDDDDDDDDSDSDNDNNNAIDNNQNVDIDNLPQRGKEKILLTDPKYKRNRIEKSSSKTKVVDLEKRESIKRSRSSRKIIAQPSLNHNQTVDSKIENTKATTNHNKKDKDTKDKKTRGGGVHSSLNLQALVKFVVSNKKFLNCDDGFTLMRRKSISEAASSVFAVAATCKPLPIALKYAPDSIVAEAPKELDAKTEKNVVLVKQQKLKNSFCERNASDSKSNSNSFETVNEERNLLPPLIKDKAKKWSKNACNNKKSTALVANQSKIQRNSSNSSKSSGNFEDEAFYSCDELDKGGGGKPTKTSTPNENSNNKNSNSNVDIKRKSSSPSLTSRVAAKINETTNNYKNRKNKKRKPSNVSAAAAAAGKRPEYYKQISVERLHATSIVRQPSDRRPDATSGVGSAGVNASSTSASSSSRPNGNAAHNSSDLQSSSFHHARSPSGDAGGNSGADQTFSATNSNATANAVAAAASAQQNATGDHQNAQDAANNIAGGGGIGSGGSGVGGDSKDARRERLHHQHQQNKSAPVSVNRSESYKERLSHKRNRNSRRKTSDPSLTSRPNDDQTEAGLSNSNYTASSNSSLSSGGGSESPSTSMEQVGGSGGVGVGVANTTATGPNSTHHHHHQHHGGSMHHHGPHHTHQHGHHDSFHGSIGGGSSSGASFWGGSIGGQSGPTIGQLTRQWNFESDDDDDLNEADWSSNVAAELLAAFTDAEKKRQEIINEIYQTERSHVRVLKLLERLFFCPLQESGVLSNDHLRLLFPPALLSLRELHSNFEQSLKQRRIEHNHVVNHVGDLLASMFDGPAGEDLREYAAQFCARQQIALEALKEKRRKDEQLQKLLSKAEAHKACRRLQLKDLLPTVLQRLTKYPLLFENLYKVTIRVVPENTTEAEAIQRALDSSKKILVDVNQAVKTAEDAHKLQNIQRKLDKSTFDKEEFKNLDLTQHRLIYDGSLTMKKNTSIQLHGLLFDNTFVLLTKQDDKYLLKHFHSALANNKEMVSPIMNVDSETLVRQDAADKSCFFLIKTKTLQMLELRAPSSAECKTWFKHISDAAEQYKPRSKNANHEPVDDPAIATLPHSNTKESLELTPERPPPMSATATVTTTPLAPMMAAPIVHSPHVNNNNSSSFDGSVQMRNGRRESTPNSSSINVSGGAAATAAAFTDSGPAYQNIQNRHAMSHHEQLSPAVNRTMSTRSCGEANNNYGNADGVTLRHTQSARQASNEAASGMDANSVGAAGGSGVVASSNKRDSASIVYSNNSNNTRTLMQSSPPLVQPTAIQISISPAHTAEPVLTPAERLRRLDASIRDGLLEKQKIICDMFRLPVEHFHEIVDIAAMPEAPKDSADIALAAYAQVQSLTEVLNDYMHATPEQEISAVSTAVCDQCHEKQQQRQQQQQQPITPLAPLSTSTSSSSGVSAATQISTIEQQTPPPLPPPNKTNKSKQTAQQQTPAPSAAKLQTPIVALTDDAACIHEDDDGYCEIDELRLPALPPHISVAQQNKAAASPPPPPLPPPPANKQQQHQQQTATAQTAQQSQTINRTVAAAAAATTTSPPELIKRQSTISTDSIPEESADELTQAALEDHHHQNQIALDEANNAATKAEDIESKTLRTESVEQEKTQTTESSVDVEAEQKKLAETPQEAAQETETTEAAEQAKTNAVITDATETAAASETEQQKQNAKEEEQSSKFNEALTNLNKLTAAISTMDNTTQTLPLAGIPNLSLTNGTNNINNGNNGGPTSVYCGPNRIQHANSLEPSIPCHALNSIVGTLNAQISLLLPKINERDMERERLRKENQHLRELLNAMHERQRVEDKLETPMHNNAAAAAVVDANDEIEASAKNNKSDTSSNTPTTTAPKSPTTVPVPAAATAIAEKVEN